VVHRNAPLSETGRLGLARCVVDEHWPVRRAAERFQVSATTAARWAARYRELGAAGMVDRSSRPHHSPNQTPTHRERRIINFRVLRRWGASTNRLSAGHPPVHGAPVLTRYGLAKLRWLDRPTGRVIRRMEPAQCGDMVHVDVKKLGRTAGNRNSRNDTSSGVKSKRYRPSRGHHFLHTAIDGHSRLAYSELLADERQETAAAFWIRANSWFTQCGITVLNVLTDNGSCYRSRTFAAALGDIQHRRTRPYRPVLNIMNSAARLPRPLRRQNCECADFRRAARVEVSMTIARKPLHRMQLAATVELCQALGGGHDLGAHVALHHFQRGVT
jgi:hypothetical protein